MAAYVLSILGIVVAGIFIDIIVPSGKINKYVKSVFAIFVVAVILSPVVKFISKTHNITIDVHQSETDEVLLNYILKKRVETIETRIKSDAEKEGISNIDIKIEYSISDNNLSINSCLIKFKNQTNSANSQHNNNYQSIREIVKAYTNLKDEEIIFSE